MRIFKVWINTSSFYGKENREELKQTEALRLSEIVSRFGSMRVHDERYSPDIYLISEKDLLNLLVVIPMGREYADETVITKVEMFMDTGDVNASITAMLERLELAVARVSEQTFNNHTESPIVGNQLMRVNDLMLCEDYCSDALQSQLDDGWRIIAVCPQESRRPDYILGRNGESIGRARRG